MAARTMDRVRTPFSAETSRELLTEPVNALLGVTADASTALADLGIDTVFDLATSVTFHSAAQLYRSADGDADDAARAGIVPGEIVDTAFREAEPDELLSKPVAAFRSVGPATGAALEKALSVANIRELALWPPYESARSILSEAYGAPLDSDDLEAPADLLPSTGRYPTERVQYEVLVLDEIDAPPATTRTRGKMAPNGRAPTGRARLEDAGQLDLAALATEAIGFARPAVGALLTYTQSWFPEGLALGQLLHTVALAPGESTRL